MMRYNFKYMNVFDERYLEVSFYYKCNDWNLSFLKNRTRLTLTNNLKESTAYNNKRCVKIPSHACNRQQFIIISNRSYLPHTTKTKNPSRIGPTANPCSRLSATPIGTCPLLVTLLLYLSLLSLVCLLVG
jgi:hypothetical protein